MSRSEGAASERTEILHQLDPLWLPRGNNSYPEVFNTRIRASLRQGDYKIITGVPYSGVVSTFCTETFCTETTARCDQCTL